MFIPLERRRLPAWSFVRLRAFRQVEYAGFGGICRFHVSICGLSWVWSQKCCNSRRVAVLMHLCTDREGATMWKHTVVRPHRLRGLVLMPGGGCTGSHDWNEHGQTADDDKRPRERAGA